MVKALNLIYTKLFLSNRTQDSILFHENRVYKTETIDFYPNLPLNLPMITKENRDLFGPYIQHAILLRLSTK
jgi:hypothetical protein